jgi:hypothetical protein
VSRARRMRFELAAMVVVVTLAVASIFATFGSASEAYLVFCHLVDGTVVVGATTDCSDAFVGESSTDVTSSPSRVSVVGSSHIPLNVELTG